MSHILGAASVVIGCMFYTFQMTLFQESEEMEGYKDSPQASEGEPDSDQEDPDVNQALGAWLEHLQQAQVGRLALT